MDEPQKEEKSNFHIWRTNEDIKETVFAGTCFQMKQYPYDIKGKNSLKRGNTQMYTQKILKWIKRYF